MKKLIACIFLFLFTFTPLFAIDVELIKSEITLHLAKELKGRPKERPLLILVAGYPGAGKTTLIKSLLEKEELAYISSDAIRQILLERNLKGSQYEEEIIRDVVHQLLKLCIVCHLNVIIDANAHAQKIKYYGDLLKQEDSNGLYKSLAICLNPSLETLLKRVKTRVQQEQIHQGTEEDLLRDLHTDYKTFNIQDYSLILKNDEVPFDVELGIVSQFLNSHFSK